MNEAYEGELEWLRSKAHELSKLQADYGLLSDDYKQLQLDNERLNGRVATLVELRKFDRAEIERLRADWKPDRGSLVEYRLLAEAQAEIERLKTDLAEEVHGHQARLYAEIKRLTATDIGERLEKQAEDNLDPGNALVREAAAEIKRLRGENTALRDLIYDKGGDFDALEAKP